MCKTIVSEIRNKYRGLDAQENDRMAEAANCLLHIIHRGDVAFPVKVVELSKELGFEIYRVSFRNQQQSGLIVVDSSLPEKMRVNSSKVVFLNRKDSSAHQRFTVAHELAHYIFDFDEENTPTYREAYVTNSNPELNDSPKERRANRFAAELLMPRDAFINKFNEEKDKNVNAFSLADTITILKDYFDVPAKAVEMRLRETSCIKEE